MQLGQNPYLLNPKKIEIKKIRNMKVYCHNNNWLDSEPKLTIGKMYEVIEERGHNYFLIKNSDRLFKAISNSVQFSLQSIFGAPSPIPLPEIRSAAIPLPAAAAATAGGRSADVQ